MVAMLVLTLFNRILNNPFSAFATVIFIGAISLFIVFFILQNSNSRQKVAFDANLDYKIPYHINLVTNYKKSAFKLLARMLNFLKIYDLVDESKNLKNFLIIFKINNLS
jgi:hypothetical protein